jgi:hypothetical protein
VVLVSRVVDFSGFGLFSDPYMETGWTFFFGIDCSLKHKRHTHHRKMMHNSLLFCALLLVLCAASAHGWQITERYAHAPHTRALPPAWKVQGPLSTHERAQITLNFTVALTQQRVDELRQVGGRERKDRRDREFACCCSSKEHVCVCVSLSLTTSLASL